MSLLIRGPSPRISRDGLLNYYWRVTEPSTFNTPQFASLHKMFENPYAGHSTDLEGMKHLHLCLFFEENIVQRISRQEN
jgi:hypothetical protein